MPASDWVRGQARRNNRNLLLVNVVILLLLAGIVLAQRHYFYNFVRGSQKIEPARLFLMTSAEDRDRSFVTIQGEKSLRTGYQQVVRKVDKTTGKVVSSETKWEYVLLKVGDRVQVVRAKPGEALLEYTGALIPMPENFRNDYLNGLLTENPQLAGRILPFALDSVGYLNNAIAFLIIALPFGLLAVRNCFLAFRRRSDESSMPLLRALALYGSVDQLAMEIESDRQMPGDRYQDLEMTRSWLIRSGFFSTWICPLRDLAWAYKRVTKHSVNFIPAGKTTSVVLLGGRSRRLDATMPEAVAGNLLTALGHRAPWVILGFDPNLERIWRKDNGKFLSIVEERRARCDAGAVT